MCYWDEIKGEAKVFLEKGDEKKEMSVEKLVGKDGPRFWFKVQKPDPPKQQVEERKEDQSVTEDAADETATEEVVQVMSEVDRERWKRARKCGCRRRSRLLKRRTET